MINNNTDSKETNSEEQESRHVAPGAPNESTGIYVRGFLKITDPETGKVIIETGN